MLESIKQPSDLRSLDGEELTELAAEIRDFLVRACSPRGGHLGPNLGVVELTIALHRALDSPVDRIVWDTGHQAYVHKLLTGRQDDFATLRTLGGLSGYPSRSESPHDVIENSHASTALGYALGLAEARRAGKGEGRVVAVVGDGSLTGGVALEALNLIGHRKPDLLVILNDNGRSYAPTVGGLAGHLAPLRLHPGYETLKKGVEETLGRVPLVGEGMVEAAKRVKEGAKALVAPRVVFEDLGWQYAGPVDGHDLAALEKAIDHAKRVPGPVLLHVITQKGRGYPPAEEHEEDNYHSLGAFDPQTGRVLPRSGDEVQFTQVFGQALLDEARRHPELVAISAAMLGPTKLTVMQQEFPERVYDVGIAEQVGVTMAAGMALQGLRPVCAIYSTFLQRAFDQVMMDVALHKLPVIFVLDRSGITGEDGSSHHGVYDVTWLREIPNLVIASPRDGNELRRALATAVGHTAGPFAIRFPKSTTPKLTVSGPVRKDEAGRLGRAHPRQGRAPAGPGQAGRDLRGGDPAAEAGRDQRHPGRPPLGQAAGPAPRRRGRRPPAGRHRRGQRARRRVRVGRGRGPGRRGGGHAAAAPGHPRPVPPPRQARGPPGRAGPGRGRHRRAGPQGPAPPGVLTRPGRDHILASSPSSAARDRVGVHATAAR